MSVAAPAILLAGGPLATEIREDIRRRFEGLRARRIVPGLAVVTVGEPPGGNPYVRAKCRAAEELGARASVLRLPADADEHRVREALGGLSTDPAVHGIILQLPLPSHLADERLLEEIAPEKDVDGLHPLNVGRWVDGLPGPRPATPLGIVELLRRHVGDLSGKRVAILGRSRIVGRPLSVLLSARAFQMNATVTLCHSGTRDLAAITREAEILVIAIGKPRAIRAEHVRPGAVVVDVGIHPIERPLPGGPRLEGDVDFESVRAVASAITPVPGGVGPLTVAMLLRNLADLAEASAAAGTGGA